MKPIKLLLFEDNRDDVFIIKRLLGPSFALRSVELLHDGLDYLSQDSVDLILLDLNLPDSFGLKTLAQIKANAPTIPVVVLTGSNDEEMGFEAVENGAQDYLIKGEVDGNLLSHAIRYAIQRKRIEEELREHGDRLEELVAERTAELVQSNQQLQQEILERQRAEQQALELALEKERVRVLASFISDTSHDFRTPLSTINTSIYLLKKTTDPTQRQWHLQVIERQTARLEKLIEGLMTMTRLDSVSFVFGPVELATLLHDVATQFYSQLEEKQLSLDLNIPDHVPAIQAEEGELNRAIMEVVQNAIQFTPDGGHIKIRLEVEPHSMVIDVCDDGIGIEAVDLPRIFDSLYRADKSRSADTGGIGLGLAIARKIIEAHGGRIDVNSTPGQGSTFSIILPR